MLSRLKMLEYHKIMSEQIVSDMNLEKVCTTRCEYIPVPKTFHGAGSTLIASIHAGDGRANLFQALPKNCGTVVGY